MSVVTIKWKNQISKSHCHRWSLCHESVTLLYLYTPSNNILLNTPVCRQESHIVRLLDGFSLLHASRCGNCAEHIALFAYRITCSISRHLLSAISSWSIVHSARIDVRECISFVEGNALYLHFLYAHLGPYLFITRISYKNAE